MRLVLITLVIAAAVGGAAANAPNPAPTTPVEHAKIEKSKVVPSLLVMSSKGYSYKDGKLTLQGVAPTTVSFADRPQRLAGSVRTKDVVDDWGEGKDSFQKVPPNADFSSFSENGVTNAVVELTNPKLEGDNLTYDVKLLKGDLPAQGQESSLFIDIIGMPMTPMSFAGVARRTARRNAYWGMAAAPYGYGYGYRPPVVVAPHAVIY